MVTATQLGFFALSATLAWVASGMNAQDKLSKTISYVNAGCTVIWAAFIFQVV